MATERGRGGVRVPPHDLGAERAVIGALMVSEPAADAATEVVAEGDFYSELHRELFRAMAVLRGKGEPVDQLTVSREVASVAGREYVLKLVESVPTAANAVRYAEIVRDKARLRALIAAGSFVAERGYSEPSDVDAAVEEAERAVFALGRDKDPRGGFASAAELGPQTLEMVQERFESGGGPLGVPSGFEELDRIALGYAPGDMVIVGARTSMGKTAFALACVRNAAFGLTSAGPVGVAVFSLEMSKEQLSARIVSMDARVQSQAMVTGDVPAEAWPRLTRSTAKFAQAPLHIDDTPGIGVARMRSRLRRLASRLERAGTPLGLVVVDYVQIVGGDSGSRREENRNQELSAISRALKNMAREFDVTFLVLAQMNRETERKGNKRPLLSELRDSGSLEQDSDKVLLIYRDEYYNPDTEHRGVAEVNVAKHRNGPTGVVKLAFVKEYALFGPLAKDYSGGVM